jgi:hypothetical protein
MVLRREDVAGRPAHFGAKRDSVSISTAVWIVMCSEPVIRAPFSGFDAPNSCAAPSGPAFRFRQC